MSSKDLDPEWILSSSFSEIGTRPLRNDDELIAVARKVWPRLRAHAITEAKNQSFDERVALAAEVWEKVLRSVSKTLEECDWKKSGIANLEAYLAGAFYHRFNRALRKERRRQETIELVPSSLDLEQFPEALDMNAQPDLEHSVQVKEVIENMDDWARVVWTARQYGYSWRKIAKYMGVSEQQAKLRFQYAMRRLRDRLGD